MKKTLQAIESDPAAAKMRKAMSQGKNVDKETGVNVKLRRTGPGLAKMRRFHGLLREILEHEYGEGDKVRVPRTLTVWRTRRACRTRMHGPHIAGRLIGAF